MIEMSALDSEGVVLLVEDDEDVRSSLVWLLESFGLPVRPFAHPLAFLNAAMPNGPRCIVLDLRLPELSGIEVLERLRLRGDDSPVILITGHGDTKAAAEARALGAFDFLEKPFDESVFISRLRAAFASMSRVAAA